MSKSYNIRWRKIDTQKARKAIKAFNAKIDYQAKAHPEKAAFLPEHLTMKSFREGITTRAEFNRALTSMANFGKRGAETLVTNKHGETTTAWQLRETKKAVRRINRLREKNNEQLNAAPVFVDGKPVTSVQRTAARDSAKPIQFDFDKSKKGEFKTFAKWAEREITEKKQRANPTYFINNLAEVLYASFSAENADKLLKMYYAVGAEKVMQLYYNGHDELSPEWQYNEPIDENNKVSRITEVLKPYLPNDYEM